MKAIVIFLFLTVIITSCEKKVETETITETETPAIEGKVFVLSDFSDEPTKKIERFQPLVDYIAARLGDFGYSSGEVRVTNDIYTLSTWIKDGEADMYMDSPFPIGLIAKETDGIPALKRWKKGVESYHALFFTKKDNSINTLKDLYGKILALEEPFSTSGYMLPLGYLILNEYKTKELSSVNQTIPPEKIGWVFAGEDQNIVQWVLSGNTHAGVMSDSDFAELPVETKEEFKIIAKTPEVPRQLVLFRKDLGDELRERVIEILIDMENTEEGKEVLYLIKKTSKFERLSEEEGGGTFEYINSLFNAVNKD